MKHFLRPNIRSSLLIVMFAVCCQSLLSVAHAFESSSGSVGTPAASVDTEASLWIIVNSGQSARDYEVYLKMYPAGKYVDIAQQKWRRLKDEETRVTKDKADRTQASQASAVCPDKKAMPVIAYLPMDNMVVNLADVGGDRVAQIGVTLVIRNTELMDDVKSHLPSIRSGVLMLTSTKSASELLSATGKGRYASEILHEANSPFGWTKGHATAGSGYPMQPVTEILFSSFIVQ